jgi:FkbM family methyltransferase
MSYSQLGQDDWVLKVINKPRGYFVEFGATDGVEKSNTLLLELNGWSGIVAEPAKMWHESLVANRKCNIDFSCISNNPGTVKFTEAGEFSTISDYIKSDHHYHNRQSKTEYEVPTLTLQELLDKHNAPSVIDYLSIDTEGSEFDILENYFQSATRKITAITVEHNYTPAKDRIKNLLTPLGYSQIDPKQTQWDSWFLLTA